MKQTDKFKDLEYCHVIENGKQRLIIDGSELENKTKYALQTLLGEKLGDGRYFVSLKFKGIDKTKTTSMRSIVLKKDNPEKNTGTADQSFFIEQFNKMESLVKEVSGKLENEKELNYKLRLELLEMKNQDNGLDFKELLTAATAIFKNKTAAPVLQDNVTTAPGININSLDIPPDIADLVKKIDWSKVTPENKELIKGYFEKFKQFIPLKKD